MIMKSINLLPKSEHREIRLQLVGMQLTTFWLYIFLALIAFFLLSLAAIFFINSEIGKTGRQITEKKASLASSNTQQLESRVVALNNQIRAVNALHDESLQWSKALVELARIMPARATLSALNIDRKTGKIDVAGTALDRNAVIEFWANVKKSEYFRNINFPFANLERETNSNFTYSFYINTELLNDESSN